MTAKSAIRIGMIFAAGVFGLGLGSATRAQLVGGNGQAPTMGGTAAQQPPAQAKDDKANSLALDTAPPVNAEEDAAYKAFADTPNADAQQKIALGEAFDKKYPTSRYRPLLYSTMTQLYLQTNQVQKMEEVGDKEVQLTPTDVQTMAILGQTIPRAIGSTGGADREKELAKAEDYSKRAIEVTPTISKPANITDEQFATAKNITLAMAHSGLGLVYFRRGKFDEAIPELDQSVKIDPEPDPVNYYVLGLANEKASHFQEAAAAFTKCANMQSGMQATCKNGADEAKKLGNTQLSVPK
ncbi:MAG: tetratricopeptide repeat protein [Candidatus Acidiferrum sp.]